MPGNNHIFRCCIPSDKDYISIEGHMIFLNEISYVNISYHGSALIAVFTPLTVQGYLSIFRYKSAIELAPIECDLKGKLYINEDIVDCKIERIVYNANEHKYLLFIKFKPSELKVYNSYIFTSKKDNKLIESDLGEIIDLE